MLGHNTFLVGDLSNTSIQQVVLKRPRGSRRADAMPDTITVDGSHQANTVTVAVDPIKVNNQQIALEDVTLQNSDIRAYSVAAAITNPNDALTVDTFEGDDLVHVISTTGPGSTHINTGAQKDITGAGTGAGGNNRIIVGYDPIYGPSLDFIGGPLFIDAAKRRHGQFASLRRIGHIYA